MIVKIAVDALKKTKIKGVRPSNVTADAPNKVRDIKETRIVVSEEDSDYASIGDNYDEAGLYRTRLKIVVISPIKAKAKAVCLTAAMTVHRKFESMRFRDPCVGGVEKDGKSIGRPNDDQFEKMFAATRTLIVINTFEP
jgi:hypothetical protein